jgi:hypothetical protein
VLDIPRNKTDVYRVTISWYLLLRLNSSKHSDWWLIAIYLLTIQSTLIKLMKLPPFDSFHDKPRII